MNSTRKHITHSTPARNNLPRLRFLAARIHSLGPRPLYELLRELADGGDLEMILERYAQLAPLAGFIAQLDGDRLPPHARLVGSRS